MSDRSRSADAPPKAPATSVAESVKATHPGTAAVPKRAASPLSPTSKVLVEDAPARDTLSRAPT